jgi:glycosyltransferase involved in cell wall biosynthesis
MYKHKTVAVVVPAYNEETQIGRVIETMPDFVDWIVIVDDCSPDATSAVVTRYREAGNQRIVLIRHPVNQGVGGSIATGYKWARDNGVDVAAVMAGDGQMDPADLPALLDPVVAGETDYAKGNRLTYLGAFDTIPRVRFFGNSVLSLLTKIASGYWHVMDSQTGYTVISQRALAVLDWDHMYKRYGQPNHLLVMLNVHDFRVRDVPIRPVYNIGERSGIKPSKVVFSISALLLRSFLWRMKVKYVIRDFHPLVFFYAFAFLMFTAAAAMFVRLVWLWVQLGSAPELTAMALMFASATGLQSMFFAMWFDMENNRHLR